MAAIDTLPVPSNVTAAPTTSPVIWKVLGVWSFVACVALVALPLKVVAVTTPLTEILVAVKNPTVVIPEELMFVRDALVLLSVVIVPIPL